MSVHQEEEDGVLYIRVEKLVFSKKEEELIYRVKKLVYSSKD